MIRRIESYLGDRSMGIDAFLDSQRRTARLRLSHQARMAGMRRRVERQPIKRISATYEHREFGLVEIGEQPAGRGLSRCCTRTPPLIGETARNHLNRVMVELAQQRCFPAVPHLR